MTASGPGRSYLPLLVLALAAVVGSIVLIRLRQQAVSSREASRGMSAGCSQVVSAYRSHETATWLTMSGRVTRVLPDELGRFRHQRFILACASGQTVLIVNDVTIGQKAPVRPGDSVAVRGQYVWNGQGGLIHFTHHDPQGGQGGWIYVAGRVYAAEFSFASMHLGSDRVTHQHDVAAPLHVDLH